MKRFLNIVGVVIGVLFTLSMTVYAFANASSAGKMVGVVTTAKNASVEVMDQPGAKGSIVVGKVNVPGPSWIAVHLDDNGMPGKRIGLEAIPAGSRSDVTVKIDDVALTDKLIVAVHAVAMMERALALTIDYVKQRKAFGKAIIEFQNTQFELAACKTDTTIAKVFLDHCIGVHVEGKLDTVTASMAKYHLTDTLADVIDRCLQMFGGYGYMDEYPISRLYRDARVLRIYAGTNEIMKLLIARSL